LIELICPWVKVVIIIVRDRRFTAWRYELHKAPTRKALVILVCPWEVINLLGISVSHNIDIVSSIFGILSDFDLPNLKVLFCDLGIEPLAFEHHRLTT
jgi:hypothetical protein